MSNNYYCRPNVVRLYACEDCGACSSFKPVEPVVEQETTRNGSNNDIMYSLGEQHISCTCCVVSCLVCTMPLSCARKEMCQICSCRPMHNCVIQVGRNQDYTCQMDTNAWSVSNDNYTYCPTSPVYDPFDPSFS
jgi:hypothetical protein